MQKQYQRTFRKLIVWQKAKELTLKVYQLTKRFPSDEKFGLSSQIKRASVSVMSNIAEGNERNGVRDKLHFFNISYSSLVEVDSHSELALALEYITKSDYEHLIELINKTGFLLCRLSESKKNPNDPNTPSNPNTPK